MGSRYDIPNLKCRYCGKVKEDYTWYAPTCGTYTYECPYCGKENFITGGMHNTKKLEDVKLEDIEFAFSNASNLYHDEKELKQISNNFYEKVKNRIKENN